MNIVKLNMKINKSIFNYVNRKWAKLGKIIENDVLHRQWEISRVRRENYWEKKVQNTSQVL